MQRTSLTQELLETPKKERNINLIPAPEEVINCMAVSETHHVLCTNCVCHMNKTKFCPDGGPSAVCGAHLDGLELLEGLEIGGNMGEGGRPRVDLAPEVGVQRVALGRRPRRRVRALQAREVQLVAPQRPRPLPLCSARSAARAHQLNSSSS